MTLVDWYMVTYSILIFERSEEYNSFKLIFIIQVENYVSRYR